MSKDKDFDAHKSHPALDYVEIYGDETERIVRWENGGNVGSLAGRAARLRFVMAAADLYAIQFRA